ncbi:MAG: RNA-binding S4 domain-containing protein [Oscillospiraceae bacterium]|nr:RNA-binding S4 domain-containing protein [Oscillospiraceae bacterium]
MNTVQVRVNPPYIKLEQFLKFAGAAGSGGQAKVIILEGLVKVNGEVCTMRGKKLHGGEKVQYNTESFECVINDS